MSDQLGAIIALLALILWQLSWIGEKLKRPADDETPPKLDDEERERIARAFGRESERKMP